MGIIQGFKAAMAAALVLTATVAFAQPPIVTTTTDHAVSAEIRAGVAADGTDTGPAVGGAVTIGLFDRVAVEGTGEYLGRGTGARAFALTGGVLIDLMEGGSTVPYFAVGAGWYHSSLDLGTARFFGNVNLPAGSLVCGGGFGSGTCGYGQVPQYYRAQLGNLFVPQNRAWSTVTFNDPAVHLGGGVRIDLTRRVYLRPDARAIIVFGHGAHHTVGVVTLGVGFRP